MSPSSQISDQIDELEKSLKALSKVVAGDEHACKRLHSIVREQTAVLEPPVEVIARMIMEARLEYCMKSEAECC
jgi:hypothetical protein